MATTNVVVHTGAKIVADDNPSVTYVSTADYTMYHNMAFSQHTVQTAFAISTYTPPNAPLWVVTSLVGTLTWS